MSTPQTQVTVLPAEEFSAAESHLGRALAMLHRVLPRLDDVQRAADVETLLQSAVAQIESARGAHARWAEATRPAMAEGEIMAIIAAAVAVAVGRPHRVLDVRKAAPTVTWVNAWAIEGRFQHYSSHKVR